MSSGGSSGFPSTPAPTPFTFHPGGVRPEDLAAGISRLSVIEEVDGHPHQQHHHHQQQQKVSIRVVMDESGRFFAQRSQIKIQWESKIPNRSRFEMVVNTVVVEWHLKICF